MSFIHVFFISFPSSSHCPLQIDINVHTQPISHLLVAMSSERDKYLHSVYYNPSHPASYSGVDKLYRIIKSEGQFPITRKAIKAWLQKQETYTLHRQVRRNHPRSRVIVSGVGKQADADLMDMTQLSTYNDGYKYVLLLIDVFSRYVWTVPIKSKTGPSTVMALKSIFKEGGKTNKLRTDKGSEFTNREVQKFLKSQDVYHFVTQNEPKANFAERAIKTIKMKLYRYMTQHQTFRYIDVLRQVVDAYNNTYHRSIKTAPSKVSSQNEAELWLQQYRKPQRQEPQEKFKFKIGDWVRISFLKKPFDREYQQKWTGELFQITDRKKRQGRPIYTLSDYAGEDVAGTFYPEELQPVTISEDTVYKIEKVLRSRTRKEQKEYLVRWLGWPSKYDSWVTSAVLQDIKRTYSMP